MRIDGRQTGTHDEDWCRRSSATGLVVQSMYLSDKLRRQESRLDGELKSLVDRARETRLRRQGGGQP
jgi:hypothetical protein